MTWKFVSGRNFSLSTVG